MILFVGLTRAMANTYVFGNLPPLNITCRRMIVPSSSILIGWQTRSYLNFHQDGRSRRSHTIILFQLDRLLSTPTNWTPIDETNEPLARMRTEGGASTTDVLIKFAERCSAAARRLLASHVFTPALYSCKRAIGDILMVIMQYISRSEGTSLHHASLPPPALEAIRRDITQALELLHEEDPVFGDLRESNVLYLPDEGCVLVDFEDVTLLWSLCIS